MAGGDLFEIQPQIAALARESEEEVLQREVVEDDDAGARAHRIEYARVIAVVVAQVVDDRIEVFERAQTGSVAPVVAHVEAREQFPARGLKAVNEERDVRTAGQARQKLLAVVGDPRTLRT